MRHFGSVRAGFEYALKGKSLSYCRNGLWRNQYLRGTSEIGRFSLVPLEEVENTAPCGVTTLQQSDRVD